MKIKYEIYVVTDTHGNKEAVVVNDDCDTVQICSMKNLQGERLYFETEAYHLYSWCEGLGVSLKVIDMEADV